MGILGNPARLQSRSPTLLRVPPPDQPIVVAGTNFQPRPQAEFLVGGKTRLAAKQSGEALVGTRAAKALSSPGGKEFELRFDGKPLKLTASGARAHRGGGGQPRLHGSGRVPGLDPSCARYN